MTDRSQNEVAVEISDAQFLRDVANRLKFHSIEGVDRLRELADRLEAQERAQEG